MPACEAINALEIHTSWMRARSSEAEETISPVDDLGATLAHHLGSVWKSGAQIEIGHRVVADLGATLGHRRWSTIESGAQIGVGG
jgi:hypothetical protein